MRPGFELLVQQQSFGHSRHGTYSLVACSIIQHLHNRALVAGQYLDRDIVQKAMLQYIFAMSDTVSYVPTTPVTCSLDEDVTWLQVLPLPERASCCRWPGGLAGHSWADTCTAAQRAVTASSTAGYSGVTIILGDRTKDSGRPGSRTEPVELGGPVICSLCRVLASFCKSQGDDSGFRLAACRGGERGFRTPSGRAGGVALTPPRPCPFSRLASCPGFRLSLKTGTLDLSDGAGCRAISQANWRGTVHDVDRGSSEEVDVAKAVTAPSAMRTV
jgi:hypothetical protein